MILSYASQFGRAAIVVAGIAFSVPSLAQSNAGSADTESWDGFYAGVTVGADFADADLNSSTTFCGGFNLTIPSNAFVAGPNGCYFAQSSVDLVNAAGNQSVSSTEWSGGVLAGYNWQSGNFVAGAEVDFARHRRNETVSAGANYTNVNPTYPFVVGQSIDTDWLVTARVRAGVTTGRALFYVTGGMAVTRVNYQMTFADSPPTPPLFSINSRGSASSSILDTEIGWAAGAGAEFKINDRWSITANYLHTDFDAAAMANNFTVVTVNSAGGINGSPTVVPNQTFTNRVNLSSDSVRIGVNYRF